MDHDWHKKTAFDFGCWSQGSFNCGRNERLCGGDKKGRAYKNKVTIPSVFPDGDYVFAQVWYGGLQWQAEAPKYADYYSCSFVEIRGGKPITSSHTASFQPNPKAKSKFLEHIPKTQCGTGSIRVNECDGEACEQKPVIGAVPEEFQNNRRPTVLASIFGKHTDGAVATVEEAPAEVVQDTIEEDLEDEQDDAQVAREQAAEETALNELVTKKSEPSNSNQAINPLDAIEVSVGGTVLTKLKNGEMSTVEYSGGAVKFEAITQNKMKRVIITVAGAGRKIEYVMPYTFEVTRGLPINQDIKVEIKASTESGETYEIMGYLKLVASTSSNPAPQRQESNNMRNSMMDSGDPCDPSNMPKKPTGSWGPRGRRKYNKKLRQFRAWRAACKRCRSC